MRPRLPQDHRGKPGALCGARFFVWAWAFVCALLFPCLGPGLGLPLGAASSTGLARAEESCLDPADPLGEAGARKGVQRRPFLKRLRAEISIWGGFFASDLLSSTYTYGGAIAFYPFEDWGFEAAVHVSPFDLGIEKPLTSFFAGQVYEKSNAYMLTGNVVWSPIHFKLKAGEKSIAYGDFFLYLGAGHTFNDTVQGLTFDAGFGIKLYPTKYFGVRFDLRDYVMVQEAIAVQRVTNNIAGTLGVFVFFPNPRPYSK